jgi:hypothetical protein
MLDKLRRLHKGTVSVGIHEAEGSAQAEVWEGEPDPGLTVSELAEKHEYGLGVPPRSFIRGPVDEQRAELESDFKAAAERGALDRFTPEQALQRFGLRVVGILQTRMAQGGDYQGLAPSTEAKREAMGMTPPFTPLIVTGQLRSSIRSKVEVI